MVWEGGFDVNLRARERYSEPIIKIHAAVSITVADATTLPFSQCQWFFCIWAQVAHEHTILFCRYCRKYMSIWTPLLDAPPWELFCASRVTIDLVRVAIGQLIVVEREQAGIRASIIPITGGTGWHPLTIDPLISTYIIDSDCRVLHSLGSNAVTQAEHRVTVFFGYVWPSRDTESRLNWIVCTFPNALHQVSCVAEIDICLISKLGDRRNDGVQKGEQIEPS